MSIRLSGAGLSHFNAGSALYADLLSILEPLSKKDSTLWGEEAQAEASIRLNWIDLPTSSQALLRELESLATWAHSRNLTNIILCGMGGSSLAPEVISKVFKKPLTVLDSTNPDQIKAGIPDDLSRTIIVVSSKSGSTIETASQRALFTQLLTEAGLNPADHIVIVTDPGSPLDLDARSAGLRTINADPHVGGRYSALSAFGLVPAALMGVDVKSLLLEAEEAAKQFTANDSVAALLATLLFEYGEQDIAFSDADSSLPGISDWIEQLIAESTGKSQTGRLPVVIESANAPIAGNALRITFSENEGDVAVLGSLGEQFIFWEWVTALLGRALQVDPFNQPNVTEAKERTGEILAHWSSREVEVPSYEDNDLAIFGASSLDAIPQALTGKYIAIMAYLNRGSDSEVEQIRSLIAAKKGVPTTFGWGPRFLHSTGQYHKGGQPNGAFLQLTCDSSTDIAIPGREFTFQTLVLAQALGDAQALTSREFPLVRVHLKNKSAGIARLVETLS